MNQMVSQATYTYRSVLEANERVQWRVEDLIGGERRLDFRKPFLPESLARVADLAFLSEQEKLVMNQIRGHGYLYVFGLVEEFILPFLLDHVRHRLHRDDYRTRALLQFAGEEAKHIHLFKRFREVFLEGFRGECEVIGPPRAIADAVLAHHPLGVALVILQIEWMTQRHYLESVRDDRALDPQFCSLLRHHWIEEAQHARLDTLIVEGLARDCGSDELGRAIDDYGKIAALLDSGVGQQAGFDLAAFERVAAPELTADERSALGETQRRATRWTFLGSGMTHDRFLTTLGGISPAARAHVEATAPAFC